MINLENVVLASPEQMSFIIQGLRNPMNSWEKSDSSCGKVTRETNIQWSDDYFIGTNDASLMQRLSNAGTDHRKFMRMMPVYVRITAPLYWWKEFDTYKVGTVANSCSTMHKIQEKEFTLEDFSYEHLGDTLLGTFISMANNDHITVSPKEVLERFIIPSLNHARAEFLGSKDKSYWWQMIQLLPSSYNQTRNVMMNYEVLANIYKSRIHHKLDEWRLFCKWIEGLPYSELVVSVDIMAPEKNELKLESGKLDIRWAEDIFKNHGIKLTEAQIDTINAIGTTNIITSEEMVNVYGQLVPKKDIVNSSNYDNAIFNGEN